MSERNYHVGFRELSVAALAVTVAVFHLYTAWFSDLLPLASLWVSLHSVMILALLVRPLRGWRVIIDYICIALLVVFTARFFIDYEYIILYGHTQAGTFDIIAGTLTIIIVLELTRRYLGWAIPILAAAFILEGLVSDKFPRSFFLYGPPISWKAMIEYMYLQEWGLWNIPMQVFSQFIVLFFVLVGVWQCSGIMDIVKNLALAVAGRFTGGPAKVAVVASAFFGTIQGSSVSNVVSSGSWTIPTMKSFGYRPKFAGAVEAVSSSGGLITPPVLGLAAFVMADFLGISYLKVMAVSIVPALLFYVGTFAAVHFEAKRAELPGLPPSQIPKLLPVLARSWLFLLPIAVLIFITLQGLDLGTAVAWSIIVLAFITMPFAGFLRWLTRRSPASRIIDYIFPNQAPPSPRAVLSAMENAGRMAIDVGMAVASAGLIIGAFWASGLGLILGELVVTWSGGNLFIGLVIAAFAGLIIGMGVPFTAAYILLYLIVIPALINMGAPPLAAHYFSLFWALISGITPPVAIAAYAAAGIAQAGMIATALTAMRIALPLYFLPFFFVYDTALLGQGPIAYVLLIAFTGCVGVTIIGAGTSGFLLRKANFIERILMMAAGMFLFIPGLTTDLVGVALLLLVLFIQWRLPYFSLRLPFGKKTGVKT